MFHICRYFVTAATRSRIISRILPIKNLKKGIKVLLKLKFKKNSISC